MAGFGSGDAFGYGPFGFHDWAKHVLFKDLPDPDRALDADPDQGNHALENFIDSIKPSFDELLTRTRDFTDLRDPDLVRTQFNERKDVVLLNATVAASGRVIEVEVFSTDPSDPFVPLEFVSVGWLLKDSDGKTFVVNAVHKLRPNVIEVVGSATLPKTEADGVGLGAAVLRPMSLIELLGSDYGVDVDFHEPEAFQRSAVRNVSQWFSIKGTQRSYDIIGKISGYRVTAFMLWSIDSPPPVALPPSHIYELPAGSGHLYTDIPPLLPVFDDVAADVVPVDTFCWEVSDTSTGGDWNPPPPFGFPPGHTLQEAIGFVMDATPIILTTDLGGGRWRIQVGPGVDLFPIVGLGQWWADFAGTPGTQFFLETLPVEVLPGVWEFEVLAGPAPVFGATVDLEYQCRVQGDCGFCAASAIRVEVTPAEVLLDPEALLEGVLTRLAKKILQVVPVHVRITDIVHVVTVSLPLDLLLLGSTSPAISPFLPLGYHYDMTEADVIEVDPDHVVLTGTVFTVP